MSTQLTKTDVDNVFKRHSRPQLPVVPRPPRRQLAVGAPSKPSWQSNRVLAVKQKAQAISEAKTSQAQLEDVVEEMVEIVEWTAFVRLGTLTQGSVDSIVCHSRKINSALYMFREVEVKETTARSLNLRHPSVLSPKFCIENAGLRYLGFEYLRFSLLEVLKTVIKMEEHHLRAIIRSIFPALRYLFEESMLHGHVTLEAIRLCGQTGKILLGDCHLCKQCDAPNGGRDLEDFGLLILTCMDGDVPAERTVEQVREERQRNKVFGLASADRWSGAKRLIDFLDDIFFSRREHALKFEKPVGGVTGVVFTQAAVRDD